MTNNEDLIFQVIDWDYYHDEESIDDDDVDDNDNVLLKYKIRMFGITDQQKKIHVQINDYTPFFYIQIPKNTQRTQIQMLLEEVKNRVPKRVKNSLKSYDIVKKHIFWGFTNYEKYDFVRLVFHSYDGFRAYERIFNKPIKTYYGSVKKYKVFESNIDPMLRFMHIRNIRSCGWVKLPAGQYKKFPKPLKETDDDFDVYIDWQNVQNVDNNNISPMIVCSFDIECESEDGSFPLPQRNNDHVIQIGATFNRYGEDECFHKHMISLKECTPIEGVEVEWYDDEKQVLLAFTRLLRRMNPDIITGYNIFGFDWPYLKERADKLGIYSEFSKLGRLVKQECPYIEKILESSALGINSGNS